MKDALITCDICQKEITRPKGKAPETGVYYDDWLFHTKCLTKFFKKYL